MPCLKNRWWYVSPKTSDGRVQPPGLSKMERPQFIHNKQLPHYILHFMLVTICMLWTSGTHTTWKVTWCLLLAWSLIECLCQSKSKGYEFSCYFAGTKCCLVRLQIQDQRGKKYYWPSWLSQWIWNLSTKWQRTELRQNCSDKSVISAWPSVV